MINDIPDRFLKPVRYKTQKSEILIICLVGFTLPTKYQKIIGDSTYQVPFILRLSFFNPLKELTYNGFSKQNDLVL